MTENINQRLKEQSILLPPPPVPSANYIPYVRHGNLVQLAGVAPTENGKYGVVGKVGSDLTLEDGVRAARLCALNAVTNLKMACNGDLGRDRQFMMIRGFVNATEDFDKVPKVMNGASDLILQIFGDEIGKHARTSIGCATLPSRVAVEIDCLVIIDGDKI